MSKIVRYRNKKGQFTKFSPKKHLRRIIVDGKIFKEGFRYVKRKYESKLSLRYKDIQKTKVKGFDYLSNKYKIKTIKHKNAYISKAYSLKKPYIKKKGHDIDWYVNQAENFFDKSPHEELQVIVKAKVYDADLKLWFPIDQSTKLTITSDSNKEVFLDQIYALFLTLDMIAENYKDGAYTITDIIIEGV